MKQTIFRRITAMLLSAVMLASLALVPGVLQVSAAGEAVTVQDILGENWYVQWNGGAVADTQYLNIVSGGSHGDYSLRIGHPTEKTDLCLRYKVYKTEMGMAADGEAGVGMKFAAKLDGALAEGSWIGMINPIEPATGGNRSNLSADDLAVIGTDWTLIDKTADFYGVWCGPEYDRAEMEFNLVLEPGNYFYLDNLQGYGFWGNIGDMADINVVHNGSFERWYCAWNRNTQTKDADFAQIVDGGYNGKALRLGNAELDTDYTLQLKLSAPQAAAYSFDLWAKTEGTPTNISFELYNGVGGSVRRYSLTEIGSEWAHVEHAEGVTDMWVDGGTLLAQLYVQLPAGSFLYLDDISIVKGYSTQLSNLLCDGGFEGCPMSFDVADVSWNKLQKMLGENWYVQWNGGSLADADYLSIVQGGSHGNSSLRIGHPTEKTDLCLRYKVYKTEMGMEAGKETGVGMKFAAKLDGALAEGSWIGMINPIEPATGGNRSNLSADDLAAIGTDWTLIDKTADFYGVWCGPEYDRAEMEFNIVLEPGNYFYLDDLQGYGFWGDIGEMADINVVHNGSFEQWYCAWNEHDTLASDAEYACVVNGGQTGKALRIGNADHPTGYTLQLQLSAPQAGGYSFDLWAKAEGPVETASFELYNGALNGAVKRYSLADVGSDWTHIAHTYDVTDVWVDSGSLLVQLFVVMPAGSYLYLDDISIVKGLSTDCSNMLSDGGFEGNGLNLSTEKADLPGTTYYVDSSFGSDDNSGTSEAEPWKSLDKVNAMTFVPGDKILFKAGSVFSGNLHPAGSGEEGYPITVDMYGSGAKPMIISDGTQNAVVCLYNQPYWEINNLDISGGNHQAVKYGILVKAEDCGKLSHIYIRNNEVHHVAGDLTNKVNGGIFLTVAGTQVKTWYDHVRVENNTVRHVNRTGITLDAYQSWEDKRIAEDQPGTWVPSTDVIIRGNFLDDIGGDGVVMKNCDGGIVEYNTAKNCNARSDEANVAIWVFNSNNCVMQYNEAYGTRWSQDGEGFDVDSFCENTTVQYNYSHDNEGGFIMVCAPGEDSGMSGFYTKDTVVRYNISQNDSRVGVMYSGNISNTQVYNNTIYVGEELDTNIVEVYEWGAIPTGSSFYNNLIYNLGTGGYETYSTTIDYSNNLMYGNHPDSEPADSGKITEDPMLVAPGSGETGISSLDGYMLMEGSPAIGAGKAIENAGDKDYFGFAVNAEAPNIGAYGGSGVTGVHDKGRVDPQQIAYIYPVRVQAQTGMLPGLPDYIIVRAADGTEKWAAAHWQNIRVYDREGIYPVAGTLEDSDVTVTAAVEVTQADNDIQKLLGDSWFVSWNGNENLPAIEFLKIADSSTHGKYSLRIGHPTEKTSLILNKMFYKTDLGLASDSALGMGMKFSAKAEGGLQEGSWISMTNPVKGAAGGNRSDIADLSVIGSQWTEFDQTSTFYGVWSGAEYDHTRMEFNIILEPGDYFYLDDLQGYGICYDADNRPYTVAAKGGANQSFEQWYCAWNVDGENAPDADYAQLVEGGYSGKALRLGSSEKATNYTLHLQLPAPVEGGYSFDLWAKTEGPVLDASFELYDGSLSGAVRRYSLANVGEEWAHVQHAYDTTDVWVSTGTLLVQLYVNLPAGSFLYIDELSIVNGLSNALPNMLCNGAFENPCLQWQRPAFAAQSGVEQWNLILAEDVGMNLYMDLEEAVVADPDTKLMVTVGNTAPVYLEVPEIGEDGLYRFTVHTAAPQMRDTVKVQLVTSGLYGEAAEYSVRQYADYILTEKPEDFDDKAKALVTAMLGYGGAAQTYFAYNTDALASEGITLPASHAIPEDSGMAVTDTIVGIDFYGASLLMKSKIAIRYYFTAEDISRYTFTDGSGNVLTPVASNDKYYVQVNSINPAALDDAITVLVTAADSTETVSVTYNAISYMARKFYHDATDQSLKDLVQAIYDYHIAAESFVAS
ncbi:MAG: right-handed parallel beta-helix repeat-containing protein [Oscillospiraceae bacterium]|nr:right-handed parallel beta-helix repeat-containing protein [Oscillospiraceae bacterium]